MHSHQTSECPLSTGRASTCDQGCTPAEVRAKAMVSVRRTQRVLARFAAPSLICFVALQ